MLQVLSLEARRIPHGAQGAEKKMGQHENADVLIKLVQGESLLEARFFSNPVEK